MTFEEAEKLHRGLWGWLAETGKCKTQWPKWNEIDKQYGGNALRCFACDISDSYEGECCSNCPITWTEEDNEMVKRGHFPCIHGDDSPFALWADAPNKKAAKHYAAIIAALPWRKPE